nr:hypothetical protein BaRGS_002776 [Batillaria attramentaria]
MTQEQLEITNFIVNCVLSPILLLVGVPTNIISCLVFYKQGLRDRMNLCLFVLALVDTGYLVSVFVIGIYSFIVLVVEVRDPVTGQTHYITTASEFLVKYRMIYVILNEVFLSISVPIVTFVVVGVATAITVIKLRTAIAWRASTSSGRGDNQNQQQQAALTKMLVILSCVFMACSLPLTAISFVRVFVPDFSPDGRYYNFVIASHVRGRKPEYPERTPDDRPE